MSTVPTVLDGELPFGSFDVTLLTDGEQYVAENFNFDENTKKLQSMSARGRVSRQKVILVDTTFAADFQLADEDQDAPRPKAVFAIDADKDGNIEPYQIEKPGRAFSLDGEFKCKVSGFAMVNPLIYIPATSRVPADRTDVSTVVLAGITLGTYLPRDVTLTATSYVATGLPTGVVCSTAGVISGTPTTPGISSVKIKVTATRTVEGVTETLHGVAKFTWTIT